MLHKIDFLKYHKVGFIISCLFILLSFVGIFIKGLNYGIDFTGGLLFDAEVSNNKDLSQLRSTLADKGFREANIQSYGTNGLMVKISQKELNLALEKSHKDDDSSVINKREESIKIIQSIINEEYKEASYNKIDFVGPQVGSELILKGLFSLLISFLAILIYMSFRFEWQFGVGGVITLIHDAIIVLGFFAWTRLEFNLTAIASVLTIIGYSINDSVVIYDRIRETLAKNTKEKLSDIINDSLNSVLKRTLLTSITSIIAVLSLVILGGDVLMVFSLSMLFGIIAGSLSSIYISAPILLYIDKKKKNKK